MLMKSGSCLILCLSLDSESVAAVPSEWLLSQGGSVSTTPSESSSYWRNWNGWDVAEGLFLRIMQIIAANSSVQPTFGPSSSSDENPAFRLHRLTLATPAWQLCALIGSFELAPISTRDSLIETYSSYCSDAFRLDEFMQDRASARVETIEATACLSCL